MKRSAVKVSSAIYGLAKGSSLNICKASFPCTQKYLLAYKNSNQICGHNWRYFSREKELNEQHSTKDSPSWSLKEGDKFNKGAIVAGVATALCVSAVLYHKFHKDVKAESGKIFSMSALPLGDLKMVQ